MTSRSTLALGGGRRIAACASIPLALTAACFTYPDTSERLDDEIIVTRFDTAASFSSYTTFAVRPEIPFVGSSSETSTTFLDAASSAALVDAIARNMIARGYQRVDTPTTADLGVELAVTTQVNTQQVCYPYGYWGAYWTPYYWGYGGYPYYAPWGCSYSTWKSGTVVFDILDLRKVPRPAPTTPPVAPVDGGAPGATTGGDAGSTPPLPAIWFGATYGVLSTATPENVAKAASGIDQAFLQSPYLRK